MNNDSLLLLRMINEGRTLNEISSALGLSNKQLFVKFSMLRNSGYLFDRYYNYDGNISYSISNPFENKVNHIRIETEDNLQTIRALLTSDSHLGNINDNIRCLDGMMEYCIKEGIHIIFNSGDFFEGIYKNNKNSRHKTAQEQLSYGLKVYPYDKNILTITVLGNHDATIWSESGIDVKDVLEERRHDIIPIGYGDGVACIGPYRFSLQHPLLASNSPKINHDMINLRGHSHKFKIVTSTNSLLIYVPTISKVSTLSNPNPIPSMIDMTLKIKDGKIYDEYFQQLLFINDKPNRIGEFQYYVPIKGISMGNLSQKRSVIPNLDGNFKLVVEEEKTVAEQVSQAVLDTIREVLAETQRKNNYQRMSQIEKFNAKYQKVLQK